MFNNLIRKRIVSIFLLATIVISSSVTAQERTSISFGELSKNLTEESRFTVVKENKTASIADQQSGKATDKTRIEMAQNNFKSIKKLTSIPLVRSQNSYADFSIYGATSLLQEDYDGDGFYQTFSIIFDADVYSYTPSQLAEVYALLYISKNGGPWTHYYTTDNFIIEGNTGLDEYEVITTFLSGYSTDHYDILIDLYQVGYSDLVATYSSDDTNALYALSLESANYDEAYIEVIEITHGGSFSIVIILFLLSVYLVRNIFSKKQVI